MAHPLAAVSSKSATPRIVFILVALLASGVLRAQDTNSYILAARRSGAIEIIDPTSLTTIGRIHFDLPPNSSGLNAVSASLDGTTLYVEGPIPKSPKFGEAAGGCCVLYSIDLATMRTRQVAGVGESTAFMTANGIGYAVSPSGRMTGRVSAQRGLAGDAPVARFLKVPGCSADAGAQVVDAEDDLFVYERFGWIDDRRNHCSGVLGGAWIVDPESGALLAHVAPDLYFSELVADHDQGELYGISTDDPSWRMGVKLVRMDAQDGSILNSRVLESDFWRIAFARLRNPPAADVRALISVKR